jgi:DNA-directed RNA polymerase specialized sigma24 family protein
MSRERVLTQEAFDRLLLWLDPDRNEAGKKYEIIRSRLIKIFTCRGCPEADELADEAINRVTLKVEAIRGSYVGDPALYFYGVAHKLHLEYLRRKPLPKVAPVAASSEEDEQEYECLEKCLQQLPRQQRELVLEYYQEVKRAKIERRKQLAQKMGIALNALRIRAHRIRAALQQCVQNCMGQGLQDEMR